MSWWNPSWLLNFPSIDLSLPSGIQRRFLSFILNRLLGRFVKPGQLDISNVDSQIGSGYVQVKDVELDPSAIDAFLVGLPIRLQYGFVSEATVRIPWPNPLTSSLGLSLNSLRLIFHVVPSPVSRPPSPVSDLTESVASVAETFIHQELSPGEETSLRESFHSDLAGSADQIHDRVPGGLDPFLSGEEETHGDIDPDGVSIFASLIERLLARFIFDARDTRITLVNPGQTSYTLTIPEIRYETETKDTAGGTTQSENGQSAPSKDESSGNTRTVIIAGVNVTCRDIRVLTSSPISRTSSFGVSSASTLSRLPLSMHGQHRISRPTTPLSSSSHSDSDIDEETQMLMSQSVAFLPPRSDRPSPPLSSNSVASSMYHSAVSAAEPSLASSRGFVLDSALNSTPPDLKTSTITQAVVGAPEHQLPHAQGLPESSLDGECSPLVDDMILSFGQEPIVIRLATPLPISNAPVSMAPDSLSTADRRKDKPSSYNGLNKDALRLSVTVGMIGFAVRAWHLRGLLDISQAWDTRSQDRPLSKNGPPGPSILHKIDVTVQMKGVVILLLPRTPHQTANAAEREAELARFFEHPLNPPRVSHGYVRIHVDGCSISTSTTKTSSETPRRHSLGISPQINTVTSDITFIIPDISVFAFNYTPNFSSSTEYHASPIFITDPDLSSQYPVRHTQPDGGDLRSQPLSFDVIDWTHPLHRSNAVKSSRWRTKVPQQRPYQRTPSSGGPAHVSDPGQSSPSKSERELPKTVSRSHLPAVSVSLKMVSTAKGATAKKVTKPSLHTEVNISPFHIFVDMGSLLSQKDAEILVFVDELTKPSTSANQDSQQSRPEDSDDDEHEDINTPPATPHTGHPAGIQQQRREKERERQRLEKLVLQDLDLALDYRPEPAQSVAKVKSWRKDEASYGREDKIRLTLNLPMVRVEVRCPPPHHALVPRSGSFVMDLHDITLSPSILSRARRPAARFADNEALDVPVSHVQENQSNALLSLELRRIVVAYAPNGVNKANIVISLGPFSASTTPEPSSVQFGASPSSVDTVLFSPCTNPRLSISRSVPAGSPSDAARPTGMVIAVDIPCVHAHLEKPILDGLQLWADDLSQLFDRTFGDQAGDTDTERADSRDTSIVGSRFFAKSTRDSESETGSVSNRPHAGETIFKITVSEAFVRIKLPRDAGPSDNVRPFDLWVSDLDCLLEVKPEGKDETVVTLGLMDVTVRDLSKANETITLLASTKPFDTVSNSRPLLKLRFTSLVVPGTVAKESRVRVSLHGCTYNLSVDFDWIADLGRFFKAPPGAFESVIPSECTKVAIKITDGSIVAQAPDYPGALVVHMGETSFYTDIVGDASESIFNLSVPDLSILLIDDRQTGLQIKEGNLKSVEAHGAGHWKISGYALIAEISDLDMRYIQNNSINDTRVTIDRAGLRVHLCADTMSALTSFISHISPASNVPVDERSTPSESKRGPTTISKPVQSSQGLMNSLDEHAFKRLPEIGAAPDMIIDDLPSNPDYLDTDFGAAAGFRELHDEDLDEFDVEDVPASATSQSGVISSVGGETIRVLNEGGIHVVENYFDKLPRDSTDDTSQFGETSTRVRLHNLNVMMLLYDGYDWARTRKTIENQVKIMRRRLEKIRQLLASGQTHDPDVEETSALLFNSVYIGLEQNVEDMEPDALIAAIDNELDDDFETASRSSWQSLRPTSSQPSGKMKSLSGQARIKHLTRSRGPCIEFRLMSANAEIDMYQPQESLAGRTLVTIRDFEILDHIKTSTWKTFLTELRSDSRGNVRETESNMIRVELRNVKPVPGHPSVESRLRAKFLPLRLHVDQDALDFLKKFFSFKEPQGDAVASGNSSSDETFFQQAEVFPVDIKLDYKPRRVDYRALREGRTIELMNFFHFDGAEMTLRHITLSGVTGWARLFDLLNDLWTPDVKATQLVDVISGVSPIRSVVNVGSGVADLVLLPIAQYKKDGRVLRGVQKGTTSFVKSTAMEAIKLGARLATGTQVILEQAENVLGAQFKDPVTAETVPNSPGGFGTNEMGIMSDYDEETRELISKYAEQPQDVKEGLQSAYKSLKRNMNSAAQTILAVPMEVYERSSNEGPVRAVIRAVPIAVLKPMIGASEAVSKTLFGIHNSLDPGIRQDNEAKYKQR